MITYYYSTKFHDFLTTFKDFTRAGIPLYKSENCKKVGVREILVERGGFSKFNFLPLQIPTSAQHQTEAAIISAPTNQALMNAHVEICIDYKQIKRHAYV